eukprot:Tamp_21009.p2 GENE.Tamp_21009~~Tamp_21009.p2  ORF type:complete len:310 (+),score=67.97 Tamp_21009:30-932(+)
MAANFWVSSHCQVWLKETKEENLSEDDKRRVALRNKRNAEIFNPETMEEDIKRLRVHLAFYLQSLGRAKCVAVRQRVISTAIVYLARFYYYNSYKDFHPYLIGATALYLASKVEEHPVTPKAISQANNQGGHTGCGGRPPNRPSFSFTGADMVEAEYFLLEELKFNLLVFHPYRPMERYIKDANLPDLLQDAYHMINDSYRTDVCLHFPPHTIAIAVIIMAAIWHSGDRGNQANQGIQHWQRWFDGLHFHDNHKAQIKQVQQIMLELYDECNDLDSGLDMGDDSVMAKLPRHDLGGQPQV